MSCSVSRASSMLLALTAVMSNAEKMCRFGLMPLLRMSSYTYTPSTCNKGIDFHGLGGDIHTAWCERHLVCASNCNRRLTENAMCGLLEAEQALMTEQYDATLGVRPLVRIRSRMLKASVRAAAVDAQCSSAL